MGQVTNKFYQININLILYPQIMIQNQSSFSGMKERSIRQSYEGFQSERHETSHGMQDHQQTFQSKGLMREFHIKYPVQTLLNHFKQIFNQKGFKTTQVFSGKIMIVRLTFLDRLKFIVSSREPPRYLLVVKTQQYKSVRKVSIRRLKDNLNSSMEKDIEEIGKMFSWIDQNPVRPIQFRREENSDNNLQVFSEYQQDMYSLQATSTYMYDKIFVDRNYSMGRKMEKLVSDSKQQLDEHSQKQAFIIIGGLKQITQQMLKGFNCTRKQLLQILCHCRKTVEDYYHDRKFVLKSKQKIEFERGSVQTELAQKLPMTVKSFHKLFGQANSQKIILQMFLTNYVFKIECLLKEINETEQLSLAKKVGTIFSKQIHQKVRTLDMWGYNSIVNEEYLHDFLI